MNHHQNAKLRIEALPVLILLAGLLLNTNAQAETIFVGKFSEGQINNWEEKVFSKNTLYTLTTEADIKYLHAQSNNSASGLVREIKIDLQKTPYLNWSWRIGSALKGNNETMKAGDDYPARIYIIVSGGWSFWKTLALNYVWSSSQTIGSHWPNAYTSNAHMLALQSGTSNSQQWHSEKRNIKEDLKTYFGKDVTHIHAVAIMTDTDNTGDKVSADYGDIYFSSE